MITNNGVIDSKFYITNPDYVSTEKWETYKSESEGKWK